MNFKKTLSAIAASALMACSVSAATANAATTTTVNAASIIASVDTKISLLGSMPMKGDINGDKKITSEDIAVLEAYINKLVTITPYSRAYKILDVNWDGALDSKDLSCMNSYVNDNRRYSVNLMYAAFNTGDFNYDNIVNSSDLGALSSFIKSCESASKYPGLYDPFGTTYLITNKSRYDVNHDLKVNSTDYDLLKSYITL